MTTKYISEDTQKEDSTRDEEDQDSNISFSCQVSRVGNTHGTYAFALSKFGTSLQQHLVLVFSREGCGDTDRHKSANAEETWAGRSVSSSAYVSRATRLGPGAHILPFVEERSAAKCVDVELAHHAPHLGTTSLDLCNSWNVRHRNSQILLVHRSRDKTLALRKQHINGSPVRRQITTSSSVTH